MNAYEWQTRAQRHLATISGQPLFDWGPIAQYLHLRYVIKDNANDDFWSFEFAPEAAMEDQKRLNGLDPDLINLSSETMLTPDDSQDKWMRKNAAMLMVLGFITGIVSPMLILQDAGKVTEHVREQAILLNNVGMGITLLAFVLLLPQILRKIKSKKASI